MSLLRVALTLAAAALHAHALLVQPHSINGTETVPDGLTQKQLAILRTFAGMTFLASNASDPWAPWGPPNPSCDENDCLRYQLSAVAYAVAVAATKTPAYPTLYHDILRDVATRMTDKRVWEYIQDFPEFVAQPTFPDPVAYKVGLLCDGCGRVEMVYWVGVVLGFLLVVWCIVKRQGGCFVWWGVL